MNIFGQHPCSSNCGLFECSHTSRLAPIIYSLTVMMRYRWLLHWFWARHGRWKRHGSWTVQSVWQFPTRIGKPVGGACRCFWECANEERLWVYQHCRGSAAQKRATFMRWTRAPSKSFDHNWPNSLAHGPRALAVVLRPLLLNHLSSLHECGSRDCSRHGAPLLLHSAGKAPPSCTAASEQTTATGANKISGWRQLGEQE